MANIETMGNMPMMPSNYRTLGLESWVQLRLAELTGQAPTVGYVQFGMQAWASADDLEHLVSKKRPPMYITTTWRAPDPDKPEKNLHLAGGVWIDIDAENIMLAVKALGKTVRQLLALGIPLECCSLFASGGKGFHIFIPLGLMQPGTAGIQTARHFPQICRDFIMGIVVDGMDMGIYSGGQGRILRQVAVQRENGAYKVPLAWSDWQGLTADSYKELCSQARPWIEPAPVQGLATGASVAWSAAGQSIVKAAAKRAALPGATSTQQQEVDRPKIIKLLRSIDPSSLDYRDWLRVGAALKYWGAPDALDLWVAFSMGDMKRYKPDVCRSKWDGLGYGDKPVTIGTLVVMARKGGRS